MPNPMNFPSPVFRCVLCAKTKPLTDIVYRCECGGLLEVRHDLEALKARPPADWRALFESRWGAREGADASGVWRYREMVLPVEADRAVSMPEGMTRLYRSAILEREIGAGELHVKHEGENPTLSFKDRG